MKNKDLMVLIPYKYKTKANAEEITKFIHKKKKMMFWALICVTLFALSVLTLNILTQFENKTGGILLLISSILNVIVFCINYYQYNYTDEEIKSAVELYRVKKFGKPD